MDNLEIEKNTMPTAGEPVVPQPPVTMPTPAPMPEAAPIIPAIPQQPAAAQPEEHPTQVDMRMETPIQPIMRPIDLSTSEGLASQSTNEGKKKLVIIAIVVVAGLIAGTVGFIVWRMMNAPVKEAPVTEQVQPVSDVPVTQPAVVPVVEVDAISAIDKELNAFSTTTIDAEVQDGLSAVKAVL